MEIKKQNKSQIFCWDQHSTHEEGVIREKYMMKPMTRLKFRNYWRNASICLLWCFNMLRYDYFIFCLLLGKCQPGFKHISPPLKKDAKSFAAFEFRFIWSSFSTTPSLCLCLNFIIYLAKKRQSLFLVGQDMNQSVSVFFMQEMEYKKWISDFEQKCSEVN